MKVAMIGWEYPPFKAGGLGTHCYGLTRSLADKNISVDFYMPKTKSKAKSDKSFLRIIEVGEASFFPYSHPDDKEIAGGFFDSVYQYNDLVVQKVNGKYDLIHCHDWLTMAAGVKLKEKLNIPLVLSVHSTEYDRSGWLCPNQWFIDIEREGMEKADIIIAVSHFTKRVLVEKYGIDEGKIRVVHNAVYPLGEGKKKNIVLFLGRLTIQKGPEFFLEAAKKVLDYGQETRFVVAGKGDMLPQLIDKAVQLGISRNVMFIK
jgi:glycosyltransferase involved in cell wall biosynthesis